LVIIGFLRLADVGSPPIVSRHVVHALPPEKEAVPKKSKKAKKSKEDSVDGDEADEGRIPSFCVLLHETLKVLFYLLHQSLTD
jgi:hypothetical protein